MDERQDLICLSMAAALAHEQLFPDEPQKNARLLEVIAAALSELLPVEERGGRRFVSRSRLESAIGKLRPESLAAARLSLTKRQSPRALR